jgi:hypothetical protein
MCNKRLSIMMALSSSYDAGKRVEKQGDYAEK